MSDERNESPASAAPHSVRVVDIAGALRKVIDTFGDRMPAEARAQLALVALDLEQLGRTLEASAPGATGLPRKFDRRRR